jgi:hypothetical protein
MYPHPKDAIPTDKKGNKCVLIQNTNGDIFWTSSSEEEDVATVGGTTQAAAVSNNVENANTDADDDVVDSNALKNYAAADNDAVAVADEDADAEDSDIEDANATAVDDIDDGNSGDDGSEVELLDKGVDFGCLQSRFCCSATLCTRKLDTFGTTQSLDICGC